MRGAWAIVLLSGVAHACASSSASRVAVRSEATVADAVHLKSHVQAAAAEEKHEERTTERGPVATTIRTPVVLKINGVERVVYVTKRTRRGPVKAAVKANTKATVTTSFDDDEWARRLAVARTEVHQDLRSETHVGWGFSLWMVLLPLALLAAAYVLWRFKWIP